jgi:hypothetical protein
MAKHTIPQHKLIPAAPESEVTFLTAADFSTLVEQKATKSAITHLEAVQLVCEERNIEFESVRGLLTKPLKAILTEEATKAHLLKKC